MSATKKVEAFGIGFERKKKTHKGLQSIAPNQNVLQPFPPLNTHKPHTLSLPLKSSHIGHPRAGGTLGPEGGQVGRTGGLDVSLKGFARPV